jgi:hypothetical protein
MVTRKGQEDSRTNQSGGLVLVTATHAGDPALVRQGQQRAGFPVVDRGE